MASLISRDTRLRSEGAEPAGDASAVDNGSKAAVPVGNSGKNMRGKIKRAEPAGDASAVDEVCKAAMPARGSGT